MDIAAWLSSLGLERYKKAFEDNAIDFALLLKLTANDLRDMGIMAVGDRLRLLEAISTLQEVSWGGGPKSDPPVQPVLRPADAERRQLTVMFIDLVGSTALAARLDPEDMREVLTAYQNCCTEVAQRFEGYVAKLMGDGVLVYFGWPAAHENDAERAVLSGLEVIKAVAGLRPLGDVELAARVGISTGRVVVGDLIGKGAAQEQAVVGETPNLAARLQGLAEASSVLIGPSTKKLLGAGFKYEDLGAKALAGLKEPVQVWRVLMQTGSVSRFDAQRGDLLVPLVGREEEVAILAQCWDLAKQGNGKVVVLSGEPGIGKSRLLHALQERVTDEAGTRLVYQCSPIETSRPYHPIIAQMERAALLTEQDEHEQKVKKLRGVIERAVGAGSDDLTVLAALLSMPEGERFSEIEPDPKQRRTRILTALLRQFEGLAAEHAVLCIFEDAHWSDPSTIEFLQQLVEWIPTHPVLLLVTCRPEFASPWTGLAHCTHLSLSRLSTTEATEFVARVAGRQLPDDVVRRILLKTDGVPIFVEELTRAVIESGILQRSDGGYVLTEAFPAFSVPAALHDLLMARLDRLSGARQVAQLAAAVGRSTSYGLLSAIASYDETSLNAALVQLEEAGLLVRIGTPPDSSYSFKHALIRDAAYGSMLRPTRQSYHCRIAAALERQSPALASNDDAFMAHHYAEGGMLEPAIRCFRQAGEAAADASAISEAIDNFRKGLALLERLPESPDRAREEIAIRLALGAQIPAVDPGSEEVNHNYHRVLTLCERFGTLKDRCAALWGLWYCHYRQRAIHRGREYADQLMAIAQELGDSSLFLEAHHVQWTFMSAIGDLHKALAHTEEVIARYDKKEHFRLTFIYGGHDLGVCAHNVSSILLCALGYLDQARRRSEASLALAHELAHSNTLGHSYYYALILGLLVRDVAKTEQLASKAADLVAVGKLPQSYGVDAQSVLASMAVEKDTAQHGLALLRETKRGWNVWVFPQCACMAAMLGKTGLADQGMQLIEEALQVASESGAHWYDAELYRVRAGLRREIRLDGWLLAEADLERAVAAARTQNARYFELRAATDLAKLWIKNGKRHEAHTLLAPILNWFTEGLDTSDLVDARACLSAARA